MLLHHPVSICAHYCDLLFSQQVELPQCFKKTEGDLLSTAVQEPKLSTGISDEVHESHSAAEQTFIEDISGLVGSGP